MVGTKKLHAGRLVFVALLVVFVTVGVVAAIHLISAQSGYAQAQNEYEALRQESEEWRAESEELDSESALMTEREDWSPFSTLSSQLIRINPDYIGWIRINETDIDYPVVHGVDNDKYLTTTFRGERNASGAIFMDYRIKDGFDGTLSVIYGHNMKDGSMFADLNRYLKDDYLDAHPEITILTADGETRTYQVFAARKTDVLDSLYALLDAKAEVVDDYMLSQGAPDGVIQYMVLSTCTLGDDTKRLLVLGALESK